MRALPISLRARRQFDLGGVATGAGGRAEPETGSAPEVTRRPAGGPAGRSGVTTPPAPRAARSLADVADLRQARQIVARLNAARPPGTPSAQAGELAALGLLHEVFHLVVERAAELDPGTSMAEVAPTIRGAVGDRPFEDLLEALAEEFPDLLDRPVGDRLEDLLLLRIANENPAAAPLVDLVDDGPLPADARAAAVAAVERHGATRPPIGPGGESLIELLRAPARAHPTSLAGQLRFVRERWHALLGDRLDALLDRMLVTLDVIAEEERGMHLRFGAGGPASGPDIPDLAGLEHEPERFSSDSAWMPRLVLVAKSTHVWLDQLSRRYGHEIRTLDAIPDTELDRLARWGITGLWLIGLWERSRASQRIKAWRGNQDAAASAYSLEDYRIAADLGGEDAWANLRHRAWTRGIRLASDMVPNHMGIDSHWVLEHPEWFLSLPEPPYPAYTFGGADLARNGRVEIRLEDHYWDNSDAAVVFERRDTLTGDRRYLYHGNDGTSFPWNDTAQLDFSRADVREQVIRTIIDVARRFPIIRFDAAMVLAKKHVRRLWFPAPGEGGGIPSRAEHGAMSQAAFDAAMPAEFWREVVDRVAAEVPDTLLLAEAFWLLEGYFVRTLGMHRVYNSAFMHMLRDEDNGGYRRVVRDTLEFDPEILKRYVNFMNNPDEKTAVEQFGKGDKYIGVATLLATLPGLPMFGHGQFEGFAEKYGMEFRRASLDEPVDEWLVERHEREIVPLLHRRADFAEVGDFLLYEVRGDGGQPIDDVFAYSNGSGPGRSLVVYHNRYAQTAGWIRDSVAYAVKEPDGSKRLVQRSLADGLGLPDGDNWWLALREQRSGLDYLRPVRELRERGLHVELHAYESRVYWNLRELRDVSGIWARLAQRLGGGGVPSLEDALRELELAPVHEALRAALGSAAFRAVVAGGRPEDAPGEGRPAEVAPPSGAASGGNAAVARFLAAIADATGVTGDREALAGRIGRRLEATGRTALSPRERAVAATWALLGELGSLAAEAVVGPTSRAWLEELRLAPAVAAGLRDAGLDEGDAWWAVDRVRALVGVARPADLGRRGAVAGRLVDAWLDDPAIRAFLRVNVYEGVEWFHQESFEELVGWVAVLEALDAAPGEPRAGRRDAARTAGDGGPAQLPRGGASRGEASTAGWRETVLAAAADAGFRVDRLRERLGTGRERGSARGSARGGRTRATR